MKKDSRNRRSIGAVLLVLTFIMVAGLAKATLEQKTAEADIHRNIIREWRSNVTQEGIELIDEGEFISPDQG